MSHWTDWSISEREMMEAANAAIFYDRPDLQFKFDGSAPPLIPSASCDSRRMAETQNSGSGRSPTGAVGSEADETPNPSSSQDPTHVYK